MLINVTIWHCISTSALRQPTTNQTFRNNGLSFNPLSATKTHSKFFSYSFEKPNNPVFLNHWQTNTLQSKSVQYQTELPRLDERYGKITANVAGYRISNIQLKSIIFETTMQSYFIPVYVMASFVGRIYLLCCEAFACALLMFAKHTVNTTNKTN